MASSDENVDGIEETIAGRTEGANVDATTGGANVDATDTALNATAIATNVDETSGTPDDSVSNDLFETKILVRSEKRSNVFNADNTLKIDKQGPEENDRFRFIIWSIVKKLLDIFNALYVDGYRPSEKKVVDRLKIIQEDTRSTQTDSLMKKLTDRGVATVESFTPSDEGFEIGIIKWVRCPDFIKEAITAISDAETLCVPRGMSDADRLGTASTGSNFTFLAIDKPKTSEEEVTDHEKSFSTKTKLVFDASKKSVFFGTTTSQDFKS
eukprot:171568_1